MTFQQFILTLSKYWMDQGCIWGQPYDLPMGAGTFHGHTFLRGVGPEPWKTVYVQPCRRPVDGRYGESPYRFQSYYQLQVLLKPAPENIVEIFLNSLAHVGISLKEQDIGLLEDNWKGPTLGAWGLGWEVRANGQEVTQFTYFQQLGGLDVDVVCGEITYGLERLYMYAFNYESALDIPYNEDFTWGEIFKQNEYEFSHFNFKHADVQKLRDDFIFCEDQVASLCDKGLVLPAYDYVLQASHSFNLLDARGVISVSERQRYIARVRDSARKCALLFRKSREDLGFPIKAKIAPASIPVIEDKIFNSELEDKEDINIVIELGVEEMPPTFQKTAIDFLENKLELFKTELITVYGHQKASEATWHVYVSSRRIILYVSKLPHILCSLQKTIWGPTEKIARDLETFTLTDVARSFCLKNQIPLDQVTFKDRDGRGNYLFAEIMRNDGYVIDRLKHELKQWIYDLPAELKMRWADFQMKSEAPLFVRPVRWCLALVDDKVLPFEIFDKKAGRITYGQRVLSPEPKRVEDVAEFFKTLRESHVEFEQDMRRASILKQIDDCLASKAKKGKLIFDSSLLNYHVGQSEDPIVFIGEFDSKYLRMPKELIVSVIQKNMLSFCVEDETETLLPFYVGVSNYAPQGDKGVEGILSKVRTVVEGRLDDGLFYFDQDLERGLDDFRELTKAQVFQDKMGSVWDKSERLAVLMDSLCQQIFSSSSSETKTSLEGSLGQGETAAHLKEALILAARYSKSDLRTGCVQEFPDEMQGVMGALLFQREGSAWGIKCISQGAKAIFEHYRPTFGEGLGFVSGDEIPSSLGGLLLALCDRSDSLCLLMGYGVELKGNKDPFGLRRLANGLVRILSAPQLSLSLDEVLDLTLENFQKHNIPVSKDLKSKVLDFILERLKATLKAQIPHYVLDSFKSRLSSMPLFILTESLAALVDALTKNKDIVRIIVQSSKRLENILASKKNNSPSTPLFDSSLFRETEEHQLSEAFFVAQDKLKLESGMNSKVEILGELAQTLDLFFQKVIVMHSDPLISQNRLLLLENVYNEFHRVCDFTKIQVLEG